jgi:medium-chain acyl-[acyl-carrier-protein] hydrolase
VVIFGSSRAQYRLGSSRCSELRGSGVSSLITNPWFIRYGRTECPTLRLFCFAYAGGNAGVFATWAKRLPENVELVALQLPGRLSRLREPAYTDMAPLVAALKPAVLPLLDRPYAMFGYSLGSRIAYELTRQLQDSHHVLPGLLVAAASRAPHLPSRTPPIHHLPDEVFLAKLASLNGTPREVLGNEQLMHFLLPTLKADFRVADTYRPAPTKLECPLAVLAGLGDAEVNYPELLAWRELTRTFVGIDYFAGDHFFINQCSDQVIGKVSRLLDEYALTCGAS